MFPDFDVDSIINSSDSSAIVINDFKKEKTTDKPKDSVKATSKDNTRPSTEVKQPQYNFGTAQLELKLDIDVTYYIVPSLFNRTQKGTYFVTVYAETDDFILEGVDANSSSVENQPMVIGAKSETIKEGNNDGKVDSKLGKKIDIKTRSNSSNTPSNEEKSNVKELKMTKAQYYEKKEQLRERLISECKRLSLNITNIMSIFTGKEALTFSLFKRRMLDLGFDLADFHDDELVVLDEDNNETISKDELLDFLKLGMSMSSPSEDSTLGNLISVVKPIDIANKLTQMIVGELINTVKDGPSQPVDDSMLKANDMEGVIGVSVISGRRLREISTWFNSPAIDVGVTVGKTSNIRKMIKYDPSTAQAINKHVIELRTAKSKSILSSIPEDEEVSAFDDEHLDDLNKSLSKPDILKTTLNSNLSLNLDGIHHRTEEDDNKSLMSGFMLSTSQLDIAKQKGQEAAIQLHNDSVLHTAEINRTKNLFTLKKTFNKFKSVNSGLILIVIQ